MSARRGADDQGHTGSGLHGQPVAEGLPRTGGEHHNLIDAIEDVGDHETLDGVEVGHVESLCRDLFDGVICHLYNLRRRSPPVLLTASGTEWKQRMIYLEKGRPGPGTADL